MPGQGVAAVGRALSARRLPQALKRSRTHNVNYPIREGLIENWDNMEKLWQRCIFKYLRCEPEDHYFLLTEPPLNTPVRTGPLDSGGREGIGRGMPRRASEAGRAPHESAAAARRRAGEPRDDGGNHV